VLNEDVALGILLAGAKLDVAPPQGDQFTAAQARPQCSEKQWVVLGAELLRRFEECLGFFARKRHSREIVLLNPGEPIKSRRRIGFNQAVLDRVIEGHARCGEDQPNAIP